MAPFWFWHCHLSTGASYLNAVSSADTPDAVQARTYQIFCLHILNDFERELPLLNEYLDQYPDDPLLAIRTQLHHHAGRTGAGRADNDRFEALDHPLPGEWVGMAIGAVAAVMVRGSEDAAQLLERLEPLYAGTSPIVDAGIAYGRTLVALAKRALRHKHAEYFCDLAARQYQLSQGPDEQAAWKVLDLEWDNLRGAYDHAMLTGDFDLATDIVTTVFVYAQSAVRLELVS